MWLNLKKTVIQYKDGILGHFKNTYKKIRKTGNLESIHEQHLVERKNKGREPEKNSSLRRL
jgi:hypothetical protein